MHEPRAMGGEGDSLVSRVVASIVSEVRYGTLAQGDRIPSERMYANQLKISRNTVAAAYALLERQGVIRRLHGKGSFLCALPGATENFSWAGKISNAAGALDEPVLELLARKCAGDIAYPLSAGTPALSSFPTEIYREHVGQVLADEVPSALAVAPSEGQWRLRVALAEWLGSTSQNVMVTAGAQEGIDLLARCLLERNDSVVIDSPTYPGAIQSFRSAGARLLPWSTNWSLDELEDLLVRYRPKLIFTTPSFQNPTGRVMNAQKREGLLALAYRYRTPIIEDDVYSRLYFKDEPPLSLYKQDTCSQVIAVSTFSKMLAPGLRIGWVVAPVYMIKQLSLIKMRSNLFTGGLNQLALNSMLREGEIDAHLRRLRLHHQELCQIAAQALQPLIAEGILRATSPGGGLYNWCRLQELVDAEAAIALLETRGVSVAPGIAFQPTAEGQSPHFRICFTACEREPLKQAMKVLADTLREISKPESI